MSDRMERLADLPIRTATDFIAQDGDGDTAVLEGEVVDYLLDEHDRLRDALQECEDSGRYWSHQAEHERKRVEDLKAELNAAKQPKPHRRPEWTPEELAILRQHTSPSQAHEALQAQGYNRSQNAVTLKMRYHDPHEGLEES